MFAYGSGLAASMFRIVARTRVQMDQRILTSLGRRVGLDPEEYTRRMGVREKDYERKGFVPKDPVEELAPGTVYLDRVDEKWRRFYKRVENTPKL
jgi:hydroxymethylglutaryl-CoA synthase